MLNKNVTNVSSEEANKLILENKDMVILDVRTAEEYKSGHIPGAKLYPLQIFSAKIMELEKYKEKPVLVYCASGGRSPSAVKALLNDGFQQVYHMNHGISSWRYPVKR